MPAKPPKYAVQGKNGRPPSKASRLTRPQKPLPPTPGTLIKKTPPRPPEYLKSTEQLLQILQEGDVLIKVVQPEDSFFSSSKTVARIQSVVKGWHDAETAQSSLGPANPDYTPPKRSGIDPRRMHVAMYIGDGEIVEEGSGRVLGGLGELKLVDSGNTAFDVYRYCDEGVCKRAAKAIQEFRTNLVTRWVYGGLNPLSRSCLFGAPIMQISEQGPLGRLTRKWRSISYKSDVLKKLDLTQSMICSEAVIAAYQYAADDLKLKDPIDLDAAATSPMKLGQYFLSNPAEWPYQFSALKEGGHWIVRKDRTFISKHVWGVG
jgi:hypothetical protein